MKTSSIATSAAWLLSGAKAAQFVMYTPGGDDPSIERADPILSVGKISQHVHQIWGSSAFSPDATYESLQQADCTTVGDASGNGNAQDKSIYWHPAMYMELKDGSGYIKVPTNGHKMYYQDAGTGTKREPFEFPKGFRMLAGNPFMRAPATDLQQQNITQWVCHGAPGWNQGTAGGFPDGVTTCEDYPGFNGAIHFPHCWNGDDFNPADPGAHVSYPTGDISQGECPSSHPTKLPHIFMENQFDINGIADQVKPGSFVLAMGDDTGYGWHADFYNGWDEGAIPELMATCPQGQYGNEDIGLCPSFKKTSIKNSDCKLKTFYQENVEKPPNKALPGCNPISDTNPAPIMDTQPLGTYTFDCKAGQSSGGDEPPSSAPASSPASSPASTPSSSPSVAPVESSPPMYTPSPSTMVTTSKPTHTKSPHHGSNPSAISCPESHRKRYWIEGKQFKVQCGIDHHGGDMKMVTAHSLGECVAACAKEAECVDVSLSGTACYMKSTLGQRNVNSGVNGAKLVDSGTAGTVTIMGRDASPSEDSAATAQRRHLHNHVHGLHHGRRSF